MRSSPELEEKLAELASKGILELRSENNPYLKVSYRGSGDLVSSKWNIKIYSSGSVVCTDNKLLDDMISDRLKPPDPGLKLVQIDDAGIGFPLCGCMIGICCDGRVITDTISVSCFQGDSFEQHAYLREYASKGMALLQREFGASPETHRIEICNGHVNSQLKHLLQEQKYDVRAVEISGLLQDSLENLFKEYVKEITKFDLGYDPKGMEKKELCSRYYKAYNWGKANAPELLKSGWKSIRGY
jgi:hypothetical protein